MGRGQPVPPGPAAAAPSTRRPRHSRASLAKRPCQALVFTEKGLREVQSVGGRQMTPLFLQNNTLLEQGGCMSALPLKVPHLLFDNTEVPRPLLTTRECCPLTPAAPRRPRACPGKGPRRPWSPSRALRSPSSLSSRRRASPRAHQVSCGGRRGGGGSSQDQRSHVPGARDCHT